MNTQKVWKDRLRNVYDNSEVTHMDIKTLERLSSWLRCYPVIGREDERKSLTELVEKELSVRGKELAQYTDFRGTEAKAGDNDWPSAEFENGDNVEGMP